ncbi:CG0192-related protein [Dietzia aurantiaca]|uniref:Maltokinase N-terminal cap domain-containing protein n=1 Tax=Dietzia aurantiaca TaxID=983873 RepID=A0ABV9PSF4_9ACTN
MSGTAEIYDAVLDPGKLDLLRSWVRHQSWFDGDPERLEQVTAYRFVDPAGEVGMESFLLSDGENTFHVPVTYRGAELEGAADSLVGTMEHSVLGRRWVYDAPADPVYTTEVRRVISHRDTAADHVQMEDGAITPSPVNIRGGGDGPAEGVDAPQVIRVISEENNAEADRPLIGSPGTLSGTWQDVDGSHTAVLVVVD